MKLYKNGILISTNTAVPAYTGGTFVQLGSYAGSANLLNGSMDEARIWNYARTGADILANMNCEINSPQSGLIAYYKFNQGVAAAANSGLTTLNDISGNGHNGTLLNFALSGATSNWILGSPVNTLPNVTASITNPLICAGDLTTLNGAGASSYAWTGGVTDAVAFAPSASSSYTVTGTDINGCMNTAIQSVVVNNLPVVTTNNTNPVICAGDQTTLSGSGTATTYTWTGGISDAVSFAPSASGSYTVTGTDGNGCMNTAIESVTVNSLPTVVANATGLSLCPGDQTILSGTGATTYTWTGGVTDAVAFAPTLTGSYTVTGIDANGCINTDVATVVVNSLPTVVANTTSSAVCLGSFATLSGSGASTYTWTGGITDAVAFAPTITGTYTVTGTDANGCVNTDITAITVNSLPVVTASIANSIVCSGNPTTVNGAGALTYTWTSGITDAVAFLPLTSASYTVTGTDANGCTNTAAVSITVNSLPTVTASSTSNLLCAGQSATLNANGATTYTWNTNANTSAITITPGTTTTYTISGSDVNGCMNSFVITQSVSICTGIATNKNNTTFNMFPNPSNGLLNIETESIIHSVEVIDVTGKIILSGTSQNSSNYVINLFSLQNAIYLVRVIDNSGSVMQGRVVVQK